MRLSNTCGALHCGEQICLVQPLFNCFDFASENLILLILSCLHYYFIITEFTKVFNMEQDPKNRVTIIGSPDNWEDDLPPNHSKFFANILLNGFPNCMYITL